VAQKLSKREFLTRASGFALFPGLLGAASHKANAQPADLVLNELAMELEVGSAGKVLRPGHADYAKIKYYNGRFDCVRPNAYIRPRSVAGVQKIVEWAKRHNRKFAIRGAGHSFEGKSCHSDIVIDMSRLTDFKLNPDGTLDVEAGVLLGDIYKTLSPLGRVLPAGTCPSVGVVGHALGGGIGDFLPMFGYVAQSLIKAKLVTMNGDVLTVSDEGINLEFGDPKLTENISAAELMKSLRGGGQGAFGVITSMSFKTYDVRQSKLASFQLDGTSGVSARRAVSIIQSWFTWRETLPTTMQSVVSSKMNLSRSGDSYDFDIAGLITIPPGSKISVADVQKTLGALFKMPEFKGKKFSPVPNAAGAIKTFLDTDETTYNPKRKMLYGSSSALPASLSRPAITHLINSLETSIFASLYTSGGNSNSGKSTSLHPSEFLIEWSTYSAQPDPQGHNRIKSIRSQVMKLAAFEDLGFPNYPDDSERLYFKNPENLSNIRDLLDPNGLSTSSLLSPQQPRAVDDGCR
jgi:FAD/FMN-containing dehydrogenase